MKLENLVCDREFAEKLKSLGYPQESVFWWVPDQDKEYLVYHNEEVEIHERRLLRPVSARIAAPTAGELGEKLPSEYKAYRVGQIWFVTHSVGSYVQHLQSADTLVNAMAKMLIYLAEQGLIQF